MTVAISKWLNIHPGSRIGNRVVTYVQGQIGRDVAGDLACGRHYRKLVMSQAGNWSCPVANCETLIETQPAS